MSDDKTEEPSEQALRKAREEGEVAKSSDLVDVACLAVVFLALQSGATRVLDMLRAVVYDALDFMSGTRSMQDMQDAFVDIGLHTVELLCSAAVLALAAALLALMPQTGLQISMTAAMPKLESVSPGSGLQRIFAMSALIDLVKMVVKTVVIAAVMWQTVKSSLPLVASALNHSIPQLSSVLWSVISHIVMTAIGVFLVIGAVDFKLQKMEFIKKHRMSKDEVKRESKESNGDPEMKGERKRLAREMANEGPKRGVGRANVVVVNPTHYAVALRYEPSEFPLPVVIAKGVDAQAMLLRRYATELGVPIVANPPVARMLHRIPERQPVPEELFEVVAAILKWVDGLKPKAAAPAAAVTTRAALPREAAATSPASAALPASSASSATRASPVASASSVAPAVSTSSASAVAPASSASPATPALKTGTE